MGGRGVHHPLWLDRERIAADEHLAIETPPSDEAIQACQTPAGGSSSKALQQVGDSVCHIVRKFAAGLHAGDATLHCSLGSLRFGSVGAASRQ